MDFLVFSVVSYIKCEHIYITFYNYIVILSMSNFNDLNLKVPQWHQKESENHLWHNEAEDAVCRSLEVAGLDKHGQKQHYF